MLNIRILSQAVQYGLICFVLEALCLDFAGRQLLWAQEAPPVSEASPKAAPPAQNQPETLVVPPDAAVLTINGLCNNPKTHEAAPPNCKTVITRAEFEKLIAAVQPGMKGHARREFALSYANALVMAKKAEEMGLDKGEVFEEQMKVARLEVLTKDLKKVLQNEASTISDADIEKYYHDHSSSFEEAEMERIYVPKTQDSPGPADKTVADGDKQKQLQHPETSMRDFADRLHARAIAGEDFKKLQAEAYEIAGIKAAANPNLGKIRRISLPRDQVSVIDLQPGEVSSVIEALNGYFIYRMKNKDILSLAQASEEIRGILRSQRLQDETREIEESATSTLNENYFRRPGVPPVVNRPAGRPDAQ